ncbi:MAG: hypothetical protein ACRDN0_37385 [Trebonia sp.]
MGQPEALGQPDQREILRGTDWSVLPHCCPGTGRDTPDILAGLLDGNPATRADAVHDLYHLITRQDEIPGATAPAAAYVAAILPDRGCDDSGPFFFPGGRPPRPLRQALLEWLGSVADAVAFPDYLIAGDPLGIAACRAIRPALASSVAVWADDENPGVATEAVATMLALRKPAELAEVIRSTAWWVHRVLATSGLPPAVVLARLARNDWHNVATRAVR